jgi:hypothetical protein
MQPCNWASQRAENKSFAAIRQALCWERQASAQGSAIAFSTAMVDSARAASKANPADLIDANAA